MIDIFLLVVLGLVTWCVASEGFVGATQICVIVVLAGLLSMNFFEPLATGLSSALPASYQNWADVVALVGLFTAIVFVMRILTEKIAPGFLDAPKAAYESGRWGASLLTGYITMAFLLTALHTAPLPREFMGFTPERNNFLGVTAPDRQWLAFTQYVSERSFRQGGDGRIFDGPQVTFGDGAGGNSVWPSFPIRYATRRDRLTVAAQPQPTRPTELRKRPSGGTPPPTPDGSQAPTTGF